MVEPHPVLLMKGTQLKHSSIIEGYIAQIFKKMHTLKTIRWGLDALSKGTGISYN